MSKKDTRYSKSSGTYCSVTGCGNNGKIKFLWESEPCPKHNGQIKMFCKCERLFRMFTFPNEKTEVSKMCRMTWITNLGRKNYRPLPSSKVCSDHFVDGKPTKEHPYPELKLGHDGKISKSRSTRTMLNLNMPNTSVSKPRNHSSIPKAQARPTLVVNEPIMHHDDRGDDASSQRSFDMDITTETENFRKCVQSDVPDFKGVADTPGQSFLNIAKETEKLMKCMESLEKVLNWIRSKFSEGNNELPYEVMELVDPIFLVKDEVASEDTSYGSSGEPDWDYNYEQDPESSAAFVTSELNTDIIMDMDPSGVDEAEINTPVSVSGSEKLVDANGKLKNLVVALKKRERKQNITSTSTRPQSESAVLTVPNLGVVLTQSQGETSSRSGTTLFRNSNSGTPLLTEANTDIVLPLPNINAGTALVQSYSGTVLNHSNSGLHLVQPKGSTAQIQSSSAIFLNQSNSDELPEKVLVPPHLAKVPNQPKSGSLPALANSGTILAHSRRIPILRHQRRLLPAPVPTETPHNHSSTEPEAAALSIQSSRSLSPKPASIPGQRGQRNAGQVQTLLAMPNGAGQFVLLQAVPVPVTKSKTLKCSSCAEKFTDLTIYKNHIQMHRIARKNAGKCKRCNAIFLNIDDYVTHLNVEHKRNLDGSPRLFNCEQCDQSFNRALKLKKHVKDTHPSEPELFLCSSCGKSFARKSGLKLHVDRVHLRERRFKCKLCPSKFFTGSELNEHEDRHRARNEKACPLCGVMKQPNNYKSHIEYVHEGKRFKCNFCDALISQKCQIKPHLLLKHLEIAQTTSTADAARVVYVEPTHGLLGQKRRGPSLGSISFTVKKAKTSIHNCAICSVSFHDKNALEVHRIRHDMDPEYRHKPRARVKRINQEQNSTSDPDTVDAAMMQ